MQPAFLHPHLKKQQCCYSTHCLAITSRVGIVLDQLTFAIIMVRACITAVTTSAIFRSAMLLVFTIYVLIVTVVFEVFTETAKLDVHFYFQCFPYLFRVISFVEP